MASAVTEDAHADSSKLNAWSCAFAKQTSMPTPRCVLIQKWCATSVTDSPYLVPSLKKYGNDAGHWQLRATVCGRSKSTLWGNDWSLLATEGWPGFEIWTLRRAYWGRGFATARAAMNHAFVSWSNLMWLVWFVQRMPLRCREVRRETGRNNRNLWQWGGSLRISREDWRNIEEDDSFRQQLV